MGIRLTLSRGYVTVVASAASVAVTGPFYENGLPPAFAVPVPVRPLRP